MSTERKIVKIVSIAALLYGVLSLSMSIGSVTGAVGAGLAASLGVTYVLYAILSLACSVCLIAVGVTGVRGSNTPSRIMPFVACCVINITLIALSVIYVELTDGLSQYSILLNLPEAIPAVAQVILIVVGIVCALRVRKQTLK